MSLGFNWPHSTSKGTALLKLLHQRLPHPLFTDEFLRWFVDEPDFAGDTKIESLFAHAGSPVEEFQRIAFWYTGLRERFFDDLVQESIQDGSRQLLLLGSGFDTRYLRLKGVSNPLTETFEVDLEHMISLKREALQRRVGSIPPNLHLIPFDFNRDDLSRLFDLGLDRQAPTVCIWQGVSYYLPKETVETVLRFMHDALPGSSTLGFDCCSPSMLTDNDRIPGIRFNIARLEMNGEPYLFGMEFGSMRKWLKQLGFSAIQVLDQQKLEKLYMPGIGLPRHMWYVVSARNR